MTTEPNNGATKPYEVIVRMDRGTLRVTREANFIDLDLMMMMLSTALRHVDVEQRILSGINAQDQLRQQREQSEIARRLMDAR